MKQINYKPDEITYTLMLKACSLSNDNKKAIEIANKIINQMEIRISKQELQDINYRHYNLVLSIFSKKDELGLMIDLYDKMLLNVDNFRGANLHNTDYNCQDYAQEIKVVRALPDIATYTIVLNAVARANTDNIEEKYVNSLSILKDYKNDSAKMSEKIYKNDRTNIRENMYKKEIDKRFFNRRMQIDVDFLNSWLWASRESNLPNSWALGLHSFIMYFNLPIKIENYFDYKHDSTIDIFQRKYQSKLPKIDKVEDKVNIASLTIFLSLIQKSKNIKLMIDAFNWISKQKLELDYYHFYIIFNFFYQYFKSTKNSAKESKDLVVNDLDQIVKDFNIKI